MVKEIFEEIAEKEKQLAEMNARIKKLRKDQKNDVEYKKLQEEESKVHRERWQEVEPKKSLISKRIRGYFTENGDYPYYRREPYAGTSTNILPVVLDAIKKHLAGTSKMSGGDIEDLVRNLIKKESESNQELQELEKRYKELVQLESDLWDKIRHHPIEREIDILATKTYHLQVEVTNLKEIQSNPNRVKARAERERIREFINTDEYITKILREIRKA